MIYKSTTAPLTDEDTRILLSIQSRMPTAALWNFGMANTCDWIQTKHQAVARSIGIMTTDVVITNIDHAILTGTDLKADEVY